MEGALLEEHVKPDLRASLAVQRPGPFHRFPHLTEDSRRPPYSAPQRADGTRPGWDERPGRIPEAPPGGGEGWFGRVPSARATSAAR